LHKGNESLEEGNTVHYRFLTLLTFLSYSDLLDLSLISVLHSIFNISIILTATVSQH